MLVGSPIKAVYSGSVAGMLSATNTVVSMPAGINWNKCISSITNASNDYSMGGSFATGNGKFNGTGLIVANQATTTQTVNWCVVEFA